MHIVASLGSFGCSHWWGGEGSLLFSQELHFIDRGGATTESGWYKSPHFPRLGEGTGGYGYFIQKYKILAENSPFWENLGTKLKF